MATGFTGVDEGTAINDDGAALRRAARRARRLSVRRRAAFLIGLVLAAGGSASLAQDRARGTREREAEIAPFRFTGIEGHFLTRYLRDDNFSSQPASGSIAGLESSQTLSNLRAEVFLMTHSYVYHPGFLLLDLGAGPILDQGSTTYDGESTRSTKTLYNLSCRATILRDKPYRGSVFYEHLNPTQSVGLAQIMLSENTRYGAEASWLPPKLPVSGGLSASRSHSQGRSSEQSLDDRTDELGLHAQRSYGDLGDSRFRYQAIRQESLSGSVALPIQATRSKSDNLNLDTRLKFGADHEYELYNGITYYSNNYATGEGRSIADTRDSLFTLDLRGRHSDALQSYARYALSHRETGNQTVTLNAINAGASYQLNPELFGSVGANGNLSKTTQVRAARFGVNGTATYARKLPLGKATVSYAFSHFGNDQTASGTQAILVGERIVLLGTALVTLSRPQIDPGTVTVSSVNRTQTYVEGIDYLLSSLGLDTRVQRVVGGNIADGQEVLVDYSYDVGGTYALRQTDNSLNLNWGYEQYVDLFVRYLDSAPRVTSGAPTSPPNPARTTLYGVRADIPVPWMLDEMQLGGLAERENRREAISPFKRTAYEVHVQAQTPIIGRGTIRFGARRTRTDYDLSPLQGVNLTAYDIRFSTRVFGGLELSLDASRERDTGTPIPRERVYVVARAQWRIRQVLLSFDLTRTRDMQGSTERTRTYALLVLRRDF